MAFRCRTPQGGRGNIGKADAFGLSLLNQPFQVARHLFNRQLGLTSVDIEQVHAIGSQLLKAFVQLGFQMLKSIADAAVSIFIAGD